jgi:hypothetical protein
MVLTVCQDQGTEEQDLAAEAEGGEVDPRQLYLAALFTPGAFRQGWKKPGFLKKNQPSGFFFFGFLWFFCVFFCFFGVFGVFLGFLGFFYIFAQKREFLGFF